jgi:hypothetical protein
VVAGGVDDHEAGRDELVQAWLTRDDRLDRVGADRPPEPGERAKRVALALGQESHPRRDRGRDVLGQRESGQIADLTPARVTKDQHLARDEQLGQRLEDRRDAAAGRRQCRREGIAGMREAATKAARDERAHILEAKGCERDGGRTVPTISPQGHIDRGRRRRRCRRPTMAPPQANGASGALGIANDALEERPDNARHASDLADDQERSPGRRPRRVARCPERAQSLVGISRSALHRARPTRARLRAPGNRLRLRRELAGGRPEDGRNSVGPRHQPPERLGETPNRRGPGRERPYLDPAPRGPRLVCQPAQKSEST